MAEAKLETIGGISVAKLNEKAMDEAIKSLGLKVEKKSKGLDPLVVKVGVLLTYFQSRGDDEEFGECDNCGASSSKSLPCCPYCGVGDAPPPLEISQDAVAAAMDRLEEDCPKGDAAPAEIVLTGATDPTEISDPSGVMFGSVAPGTAIEIDGARWTAADLDRVVAELRQMQRDTAANVWALAHRYAEVHKSQIWKCRIKADGSVAYRTFEQFAESELEVSRKYANELIKMFGLYSREDFVRIGTTKLRVAMGAPEERREEILQQFKDGASRRDVEKQLGRGGKELDDTKDLRTREHKDDAKPRGKSKVVQAAAGGERKTITIAQIDGRRSIPMFVKPAKRGETEHAAATKLSEMPWGFIDLTNDVRMWFSLFQKPGTGEIVLRIDTRRTNKEE